MELGIDRVNGGKWATMAHDEKLRRGSEMDEAQLGHCALAGTGSLMGVERITRRFTIERLRIRLSRLRCGRSWMLAVRGML